MTDPTSSDEPTSPPPAPTPDAPSADPGRSIELEVIVPGTPEQVWAAIATGPGISSWYVPHVVDERAGGSVEISFGPGMEVTARVAAWEPPRRVVFDGGDSTGLAFEWLVEARDGASCVVRLVNSGFGSGEEWDDQYDGMERGWRFFLTNLRLHLEHFPGSAATASLPMATWAGSADDAWRALLGELGVDLDTDPPTTGSRVVFAGDGSPTLAGTVAEVNHAHIALVVDEPAPGVAFLAAEGDTDRGVAGVSIWAYLHGEDGRLAAERDQVAWAAWLAERAPDPDATR